MKCSDDLILINQILRIQYLLHIFFLLFNLLNFFRNILYFFRITDNWFCYFLFLKNLFYYLSCSLIDLRGMSYKARLNWQRITCLLQLALDLYIFSWRLERYISFSSWWVSKLDRNLLFLWSGLDKIWNFFFLIKIWVDFFKLIPTSNLDLWYYPESSFLCF
jgi:hypothetical protein